uniref:Uncharacterized protein n=1 Tax=Arion vulgaris TaxID=1028688 RepID=A0A0B6ZY73_9EUPU
MSLRFNLCRQEKSCYIITAKWELTECREMQIARLQGCHQVCWEDNTKLSPKDTGNKPESNKLTEI